MQHSNNQPQQATEPQAPHDGQFEHTAQEQEQAADNQTQECPITQLQEEVAQEKDKFLRLFAEFENYKKRTTKERLELLKTAGSDVILSLLPVLDDFDRAIAELSKQEDKSVLMGVELIHNKFSKVLSAKGLEQVEAKAGDAFDSEIHEAITQIPAPNEALKGKIIDVLEKGYKIADKIIRFPKVVVGQ